MQKLKTAQPISEPSEPMESDEQENLRLRMEHALQEYHVLVRAWKGDGGIRSIVGDREARRVVDNLETTKREAFVAAALAYRDVL